MTNPAKLSIVDTPRDQFIRATDLIIHIKRLNSDEHYVEERTKRSYQTAQDVLDDIYFDDKTISVYRLDLDPESASYMITDDIIEELAAAYLEKYDEGKRISGPKWFEDTQTYWESYDISAHRFRNAPTMAAFNVIGVKP